MARGEIYPHPYFSLQHHLLVRAADPKTVANLTAHHQSHMSSLQIRCIYYLYR